MDLRVERTYKSLTEAFTEMLEGSPYEAITVAALCERAMIRRTTFYKHFADKDEFFAFYLKTIRDEFEQRIESFDPCTSTARSSLMLSELLHFLSDHERLTANVINSPNAMLLFDALSEVIFNDNLRMLKEEAGASKPSGSTEMRAAFISGGILQMMRHWWALGRPQDGEQHMVEVLESM
ncbi:MAG: TetR/AcrR family transcriptional regulator [Coriobacteriales bacterium]